MRNKPEITEVKPAIKKSASIPKLIPIHDPENCPTPKPSEIKVPQIPIALPLRLAGIMSVRSAVVPVGVKPALKPCKNLKVKKNKTEKEKGYNHEMSIEKKIPK